MSSGPIPCQSLGDGRHFGFQMSTVLATMNMNLPPAVDHNSSDCKSVAIDPGLRTPICGQSEGFDIGNIGKYACADILCLSYISTPSTSGIDEQSPNEDECVAHAALQTSTIRTKQKAYAEGCK